MSESYSGLNYTGAYRFLRNMGAEKVITTQTLEAAEVGMGSTIKTNAGWYEVTYDNDNIFTLRKVR